jgi:hypothetical protein
MSSTLNLDLILLDNFLMKISFLHPVSEFVNFMKRKMAAGVGGLQAQALV